MKVPARLWRRHVGWRRSRRGRPQAKGGAGRPWRRLALLAAAAALVLLVILWLWPEPVEVEAARVVRGPLSVAVDEEGMTRVRDRYVVAAPITGQMARVPYEAGDFVEDGQVITTIDPTPLTPRELGEAVARLGATRAAEEEAAAAVAQARAAREQALRERARAERLQAEGALALQELEQARLTAETREAELAAAEATLARARAEAEAEAARATLIGAGPGIDGPAEAVPVRSPVPGQILRVLEKNQRVVSAGTEIVQVGDVSNLEVVVDVLSSEAVEIDAGDPMLVYDWGGERTIQAVVRRVEPSGYEEVSALGIEELRVDVVGELLERPGPLGDQYRVEARIIVWRAAAVLKVPISALFRREDDWAAFVIEDGRARLRTVAIGRRGEVEAQVLAGLEEGDVVILYPSDELEDGDRVEPRK